MMEEKLKTYGGSAVARAVSVLVEDDGGVRSQERSSDRRFILTGVLLPTSPFLHAHR
jgi:hypothetical protein